MRRSIVSAILFIVAGISYLISAIKGNIPLYYIFGILLLLFGGLYIKRAFSEREKEIERKLELEKQKNLKKIKRVKINKDKINKEKPSKGKKEK